MRSKFLKQKGISLVEVLLMFGVVSSLALLSLNLIQINTRYTTKKSFDADISGITNEVEAILTNSTKCTSVLLGKNSLMDTSVTNILGRYYKKGMVEVPIGGYANSHVEIQSYEIKATPADLTSLTSYLYINFVNKDVLKGSGSANTISKKIKLHVDFSADMTIFNCNSIPAQNYGGLWSRSSFGLINTDLGSVGIGTSAIDSTSALTVNGFISSNTKAVILGDTSGNARNLNGIDIQTSRALANQVASGTNSITIGGSNISSGPDAIAIGYNNTSKSGYTGSTSIGHNNLANGSWGITYGKNNSISSTFDDGILFGIANTQNYHYAVGIGRNNTTAGCCLNGYFNLGFSNESRSPLTMAIGNGVINTNADSLQIGASNTAKISILNTNKVGVLVATPTEALEVGGTLKMSDFQLTSDKTFKTAIESLNTEDELKKILQLRPVHFEWIKNHKKDHGFIAQELRNYFPELVVGAENVGQGLAIKYVALLSSIVSSIQELEKRKIGIELKIEDHRKKTEEIKRNQLKRKKETELLYQELSEHFN